MRCQHCLFGSRADSYRQKCRHSRDHTIYQHRNLIQRPSKVEADHSCNIEPAKHREHTERIFRIRVVKLYRFLYCLQFTGKPAVRQACTASRHKQRITAKQNRSNRAGCRRIANSHFSGHQKLYPILFCALCKPDSRFDTAVQLCLCHRRLLRNIRRPVGDPTVSDSRISRII